MSKKEIKTPTAIMHHTYLADYAGCGYIRCIFPSMLLSQYNHDGRIQFHPSYNIQFINDPEFYKNLFFTIFQRSATPDQLKMIKYFRQKFRNSTKTPMIYEIDDLLTEIPEWNFAHEYYNQHSSTAIEIMKQMDGMIVSTNKLKEIYSQYNHKIEVIPNHLVKGFWGHVDFYPEEMITGKPRILWAGSGNHFSQKDGVVGGDMGSKLLEFIKKTTNIYDWVFIGGVPKELENENIIKHEWQNIFNYPKFLKSLDIGLAIAPLEQNLFNECKSNIKALEYTAAGIPAIYTDIEPYKNLTMTAKTDDEMISMIEDVVQDDFKKSEIWNKDFNILKGQMFWEDNDNLVKYYNKMISFFNFKLPK